MARGPEGKVKADIKKVLKEYDVYYFMPVQSGYGASGVDFHCCVYLNLFGVEVSLGFFIEAKDRDKEPTDRQDTFLKERREQQKSKTFIIDGPKGLQELRTWLERLRALTAQGLLSPRKTLD
jgi:hypothetical protein